MKNCLGNKYTKLPQTVGVLASLLTFSIANAAEIVMPQNRAAFYSGERIEIAVAGLSKGENTAVTIKPVTTGMNSVMFSLTGDGGATSAILPSHALAPGEYSVLLDGQETTKITISSGILPSTMLVSQTDNVNNIKNGGGDFIVGNAFVFGKINGQGQPLQAGLRAGRSPGLQLLERAVAMDMPTLLYMYWTGYVTHKPFGTEKSWANDDMTTMMRMLNFHTAQRIRRYKQNILSVGTLDEPGLSWGKTSAGGSASGFPNWDEKPWYEARGWNYTDDPAARSDSDWMQYMTTRAAIMKEQNAQAKKDLEAVWPGVVFSTDLYAPQAVMDGTDPLNQQVNDIPSSHVFVDWGYGKAGIIGGVYLEKAHNPRSKLAHAMNGQLFGERVPQPQHRTAYHVMMNALLASGLHSNWWLNFGGMSTEDLKAVNDPAQRMGTVFQNMTPHADTAILWSFTEIAMREKEIAAREAKKKNGEQIKLMIASWPEQNALAGSDERTINAYDIGGNYKEQVLDAHQAINRAGYPAHILHEKVLPSGILKEYKTLVIVGQTFTLPVAVQKAIQDFVVQGGKVIVDDTTTQKFPGASKTTANFKDPYFRWSSVFTLDSKTNPKITPKQASYYQTNAYMDELARKASAPMKQALSRTDAQPVFTSEGNDLVGDRHVAGEGALAMLLNVHEQLPDTKDNEKYVIWNYAPLTTSFTLRGLPKNAAVYEVEGLDWKRSRRLTDPTKIQTQSFEAGEMKLFLVAPRTPSGLSLKTFNKNGVLNIAATLKNLKMPWPLQVTVKNPAGQILFQVFRATNANGTYSESFPLGGNTIGGQYSVTIEGLVEPQTVHAQSSTKVIVASLAPQIVTDNTRVFDEATIKSFLEKKPKIVIATGDSKYSAIAKKLAYALNAKGINTQVLPEGDVMHKAKYPRVWNPYAKLYTATGDATIPENAEIKLRITLDAKKDGSFTAKDESGKDWGNDWKQANSLVTIIGDGFVDFSGDHELVFEPGVELYFNKDRTLGIVKGTMNDVETTEEFKAKWSRPWTRLTPFVGGFQLPPGLPEAWQANDHMILLGDSTSSELVAALQASELLPQVADEKYPGAGKALIQFAWSPFALEKNVIFVGASDVAGIEAGVTKLEELL